MHEFQQKGQLCVASHEKISNVARRVCALSSACVSYQLCFVPSCIPCKQRFDWLLCLISLSMFNYEVTVSGE